MWAVSTKFFQWCSSVPCKYSLGGPVVSQCTLGQPVAFQWHSSVHWTSQCTLAQGKGLQPVVYRDTQGASLHGKHQWLCITFLLDVHDLCFPTVDITRTLHVSSWWRQQMETFSALLFICAGNSPVTGEFPDKGQWRGAFIFFICAWANSWANNGDDGDLRRHRAHYDVIVMSHWPQRYPICHHINYISIIMKHNTGSETCNISKPTLSGMVLDVRITDHQFIWFRWECTLTCYRIFD